MQKSFCCAEGCERLVELPTLFCSKHWRLVPTIQRRRIWAASVGGRDSPEYLAAKAAAVEVIAQAEGRRQPNPFPDFQTEVVG